MRGVGWLAGRGHTGPACLHSLGGRREAELTKNPDLPWKLYTSQAGMWSLSQGFKWDLSPWNREEATEDPKSQALCAWLGRGLGWAFLWVLPG